MPPWIFRSAIALVITLAVTRALEIFELETDRRIEELEQQQIIAAERERYARELHDGAIQKVYTAGLLVESASKIAKPDSEVSKRLQRAVGILNDTIADLRQNLVELQAHTPKDSDPLEKILQDLAHTPHYRSLMNIQVELDIPVKKQLSPYRSNHIRAIVNEALANAARHSQAKQVIISAKDLNDNIQLSINDDGIGLPPNLTSGYGLRNMRDRTRLLNGTIECKVDKGTSIIITVPWYDEIYE